MVMVDPVLPVCGGVDKYSCVKPESDELLVVEGGCVREAGDGPFSQIWPRLRSNLSPNAVRADMCLTDVWCSAAWG